MAVGYSPAPGVDLLHVGLQLVSPGEDHRGEGFVYLDPIEVVDKHGGGAVGDLGGVARRHHTFTLGSEDGLELRHLLGIDDAPDTLVRRDLYLVALRAETESEEYLLVHAFAGGFARFPVALGGEGAHVFACDLPLLRYPLGALALVDEFLPLQQIGVQNLEDRAGVGGVGDVAEHQHSCHALPAGAYGVAHVSGGYRLGGEM